MDDMVSLNAQIKCVEREIGMRGRVYPRWVASGKMTQAKADFELRAMRAVLDTLEKMQVVDLFGMQA